MDIVNFMCTHLTQERTPIKSAFRFLILGSIREK